MWRIRGRWVVVFTGVWVTLVAVSFGGLLVYSQTPGSQSATPQQWPNASRLPRATGKQQLIMFLHPRCPCNRASLDGLDHLMAQEFPTWDILVVFVRPPGVPAGWELDQLWRRAEKLPGALVLADVDGQEARLFGVETSGHTLVFDGDGRLKFSGGVTAFRGHLGENAGLEAVRQLTQGRTPTYSAHCVYGCPLMTTTGTATDSSGGHDVR